MRRPSPFRRLILAGLVVLLAAASAEAGSWILERAGRSAELPATTISKKEYVELADVAAFFDLKVSRERKRAILSGAGGSIEIAAGRAMVTVAGQSVVLEGQVELVDGGFFVPVDFLTRALPRLLDVEARVDMAARSIRFDRGSSLVACESFEDRLRVTIRPPRAAILSEVVKDGRRRIVTIQNQELPGQVGGCSFDETLTDMEVRPEGGKTQLTFFVGPRFASLKILKVDADASLIFDFINDSASPAPATPAAKDDAGAAPTAPGASVSPIASGSDAFDTVVIDAGHGGEDEGATGSGGLKEKALTLSVATQVARLLRERAGLNVHLTRDSDTAVGLVERTEFANRHAADLFLSIHANATPARQATGAETYFLSSTATDESARTLAALENDATGLRERGQSSAPLEMLLWDLAQQQYLDESSRLAEVVQRELNVLAGTKDRGVKQANFLVLRGATMPAILVEVGFLSNPAEEQRMRGDAFQKATAEAIVRAIVAFRDERRARLGG